MSRPILNLPSFAKINWFLRVFGKREDLQHEICTAFQTVSLCDRIEFRDGTGLSLTSSVADLPVGEENLVVKAAKLLAEKFGVNTGARIHLEKKIPFPGGLGGGSSNAAVTLLGLSQLWDLPVSGAELVDIGSQIGADVPFFLYGGTALGTGTGREVKPGPDLKKTLLLIVTPETAISTAEAYSNLDSRRLTKKGLKSILQICRDDAERLESERLELFNDFESSVFRINPEIGNIKTTLLSLGANDALLSGSGSSVFGVFDNDEKRQTALDKLIVGKAVQCFDVETVSRKKYRSSLESCQHLLPEIF